MKRIIYILSLIAVALFSNAAYANDAKTDEVTKARKSPREREPSTAATVPAAMTAMTWREVSRVPEAQ